MQKLSWLVDRYPGTLLVALVLAITLLLQYVSHPGPVWLNLYYLPALAAACLFDARRGMLVGVLSILAGISVALLHPELWQSLPGQHGRELFFGIWAGCLLLAVVVAVGLRLTLVAKLQQARRERQDFDRRLEELHSTNVTLRQYGDDLERQIEAQALELERAREAVADLQEKVESTLYVAMDPAVAKLIIEGRLRNEKRHLSIMFADLVGFTSFSEERSPEIVVRELNRFLRAMEPILLDYRGHIDKYLGDGIMCEFGAPVDHEHYRLLAVLAAVKMQEKMAAMDFPWPLRLGIASGEAIVGLIGSRRQSYTTIGDVVNLASRLEQECPPGEVLIDATTLEGVDRYLETSLYHHLAREESLDPGTEKELARAHRQLESTFEPEERASLFSHLGQLYLRLGEPHEALTCLERALRIFPDHPEYKLAYAEAAMKSQEQEKLTVKGRRQRVAVYQVKAVRDPFLDSEKITTSFRERYYRVLDLINIPEDVILPVEALDGSIGHGKIVAVLSYAVAEALGIADREKLEILHAGYVADIGKKEVDHHLLNRAGSLNPSELAAVRQHAVKGLDILRQLGYESASMLEIIRHSHENYDGSGYPDGLQGKAIPLGARIIAVADAYDALTSWRPYRHRWHRQVAYDELRRGAERGSFDPQVVETMIAILG